MILVTGGTGLVGAHLLRFLLCKNRMVRATKRPTSTLQNLKQVFKYYGEDCEELLSRIEWMEADITNITELDDAFRGITQVYHCAAMISFDPKDYYELKKVNRDGTANVVNLCLSHNVQKLCHVSTIAIFDESLDGSSIDEEDEWNPEIKHNVYAITKYGAEMEVWRGIQEGLRAVIINPGVILGEGFWHTGSGVIITHVAKGIKYYPQGGTGFVDIKDVVNYMHLLMDRPVSNERYILVGHNLLYQELLQQLAPLVGASKPRKKVSKNILLFLANLDAIRVFVMGGKRKLIKEMAHSMDSISTYNGNKIVTELTVPYTTIDQTLDRIAHHYSLTP